MVRILHTGDVHLGKKFTGFGDFGKELRNQVRVTFLKLLRDAPRQADLVLVAGDLFENNQPDPGEVRSLLGTVRQIAPLPVCMLPGTHDCFSSDSVYRRPDFAPGQRPANLYIFSEDGPQTFPFPGLGVAVHGRANLVNRGGEPPLKDIRPHPQARFNVAVAHASIPLPHFEASDEHDYYVRPEQAEASGMNYIALAHWHRFGECFPGSAVRAFYCGSPEVVDFGGLEARGTWARVQLSETDVSVVPETSGRFVWRDVEFDVSGQQDDAGTRQQLELLASSETILRLPITGRPATYYRLPFELLEKEYADQYAHLSLCDQTARDVPWEELAGGFAPNTIGDLFCRAAHEKLAAAAPGEREHWSEVLRRGAALLLGKEEVEP